MSWIDDFAVLATFEGRFEAVETKTAALALLSVAAKARLLQHRADVLCIGKARGSSGRWKLGQVRVAPIQQMR